MLNIFSLYPPEREKFLGRGALSDIAIQLHAFAINVYAIFDNIAWVCLLEGGGTLPYSQVGLFKRECKLYLPADLQTYLEQGSVKHWFDHYGKLYRDSTAHRIPPYLPSRVFTPDEGARYKEMHRKAEDALLATRAAMGDSAEAERLLAEHEEMVNQKEAIGRNSQLIALSLTGEDYNPPVFMHPQLLCDLALVHELLNEFTKSFRQSKGWPEPFIPPMRVN